MQRYISFRTPRNLMIVRGLAVALIAFLVTWPGAGARSAEPTGSVAAPHLRTAAASVPGARFVHVSTDANRSGDYTIIDHPLTNNNPNAIVFVTQNSTPGGFSGVVNSPLLGVWYTGSKWTIFNQDLATMPKGVAFNVLIPDASAGAFVHTANAGNTDVHVTTIDNPLTNNNPNAFLLVTQNYSPGGGSGTYNNHPVQVTYLSGRWFILNQDFANMPSGASFNVLVLSRGPDAFVHTTTAENTNTVGWSYIDSSLTNGNPNAIVLVTQNGAGGVNNHPLGVRYDILYRQWAVFNRYSTDMPAGRTFNVLVPTTGTDAFFHKATTANIHGNWTEINNPLTNNNPNAILFVTQNWNPGGVGGTSNNHPIGVWYTGSKWAIFNQDLANIPEGAAFNVLVPSVDAAVFTHISRSGTITGASTVIDYPLTDDESDAVLFATQNWNPSGLLAKYNNHPAGVIYNASNKWAVFNEDIAAMSTDVGFNLLVRSADTMVFVHRATAGNIAGSATWIDSPLTNNNPYALLLVTQSWNTSTGSTYNGHPFGVRYGIPEKKWGIFNEDGAAMTANADFHVMVVFPGVYVPTIMR